MSTQAISIAAETAGIDCSAPKEPDVTCDKLEGKGEKENAVKVVGKEEVPVQVLAEAMSKAVAASQGQAISSALKPARMVPLVYIQAPTNIKVPASTCSAKSNPQIIKSATSPNAQTLIPVSVATSTGTKQTFAYLGTIIKPALGGKATDNQIVVPTNHLPAGLVPAPTNQKLVLTPMSVPKLAPRLPTQPPSKLPNLILPMPLNSQLKTANPSVINFKISNGQFQSDPKGSITVLCDSKSVTTTTATPVVPPTTPSVITNAESALTTPMAVTSTLKVDPLEKVDPPSDSDVKPILTTADIMQDKPLSEKSYELSIPEVPTSKCEISYTISIPDDDSKFFQPIKTEVLSTDTKSTFKAEVKTEKGTTQPIVIAVPKQEQVFRKQTHEVSILKKCNLSSLERKSDVNKNRPVIITKTSDVVEAKPPVQSEQTDGPKPAPEAEVKPQPTEVRKSSTERRRKSNYTYLRDFDEVVVTSGNAWENKSSSDKYTPFQSSEITFTKLSGTDDEPKDKDTKKSMDDFIEIELVKQELPQFSTEDDQDIKTALKWKDGIGFLPGSKLKFHINEFGFIEMLVDEEYEKLKSIKKEEEPPSGDEILCCSECGCYGMPSEFVSRNYCSKLCKATAIKTEAKKAYLQEAKAKRKKKKLAMMQKQKSEDQSPKAQESQNSALNSTQSDDDNTSNDVPQDKINYPWQVGKKGFSWSKYLDHVKGKAAPVKLFKDPFPYANNGFRPGMKLEGIDPQHPSYFCVMTVSEVRGYRMRLHFDGYCDSYDFWVNADSMDIFPVGWCEKFNHTLHPPPNYMPSEFNWTTYLKQCKATPAPRQLFANRAGNSVCPNGFRLGMKLEAVDKKNTSLVCVATVTDQMDNRFLVHFDSWDDIYDYWADPSSPYIHPVGWCDQFGHNLTPPNDYPNPETFTWEKYLKETKSVPAPVRAFKQRPSNGFKRDMRLECVDKRVPSLIRVATVEDVRDHQIKIRFDGWPNKYSYWVDDDSPDIHPPGWCQKTKHPLESPLTPEDVYDNFQCPTVGCRGIGHIEGAKYMYHNTSKDCPYSDENLNRDCVLPDRLTVINRDFIPESVVPVSREPRDKIKSRTGRPAKIRRLTDSGVKEEWLPEDELSDSSRKRKFAPGRERDGATSPTFSDKSKVSETESSRYKSTIVGPPTEYPTCPSQQVLAKHSKILSEIISTSQQDPRLWSQDEVAEFVNSLPSCREHSKLFVTHKIDGEAFLMLTQQDLVDILKFKLGPAIKLYNSIVLLRRNVTFYN